MKKLLISFVAISMLLACGCSSNNKGELSSSFSSTEFIDLRKCDYCDGSSEVICSECGGN